MKVIVDTNIVFSSLLKNENQFSDIIFNSDLITLISVQFLKEEIKLHKNKLIHLSKIDSEELEKVIYLTYKKIQFINEYLIPEECFIEAENLLEGIDNKDVPFLALSIYTKNYLWTGDKKLYNGLKNKGYNFVITTNELKEISNNGRKENI